MAPQYVFQMQRLTKAYGPEKPILNEVSLSFYSGAKIGVLGYNGAGKSTLLKILSRITEPTIGRVELYGRVGSLLEVGTGFHPELSGRENIYLNGSILGMTRLEIESKFDEIVAFSEIEKFLDTPVKRYSSGMYVRLAFAVAAHLQPEILIVDEVLAVGDYAFQQKCLNKMQDVSTGGRTVLFVSHNMGAISRLCQRCIVLDQGRIVASGPTAAAVQTYMTSGLMERAEDTQNGSAEKATIPASQWPVTLPWRVAAASPSFSRPSSFPPWAARGVAAPGPWAAPDGAAPGPWAAPDAVGLAPSAARGAAAPGS